MDIRKLLESLNKVGFFVRQLTLEISGTPMSLHIDLNDSL